MVNHGCLCTILHGHGILAKIMARSWQDLGKATKELSMDLGKDAMSSNTGDPLLSSLLMQKHSNCSMLQVPEHWIGQRKLQIRNQEGTLYCNEEHSFQICKNKKTKPPKSATSGGDHPERYRICYAYSRQLTLNFNSRGEQRLVLAPREFFA